MAHKVTLIPGDGIGPELTEAAIAVLEATGINCHWQVAEMGHGAWERYGNPVPAKTLATMRSSDASLKGPCTTVRGAPYRSANVIFRVELDLFASVRPCKAYPGVRTLFPGTDLVVIRGNTEDRAGGGQFPAGSPHTQAIIQAVRNAGAVVEHVFVNFYYDIFPESKKILSDLSVKLHYLATWWDVLAVVKQGGYLPTTQIGEVEKFLNAPAQWSAAHGGAASSPST